MNLTPKSLRLHIGLFGRTNVGKSSFLNMVAGQDVAIVSTVPGTTTDVVEKPMELLPLGPVVFLDTAGVDDSSELAELRLAKTRKIFDRAEVIAIILEPGSWTAFEDEILAEAEARKVPVILVVNKIDLQAPSDEYLSMLRQKSPRVVTCSSIDRAGRERYLAAFKQHLLEVCPEEFLAPPPLMADLLSSGSRIGMAVLVVPIDLQAPRGRLILPQVQAIRDCLDGDAAVAVVKEREYPALLKMLAAPPDVTVCDSQVVLKVVGDTPPDVRCTTFSILFARNKGDLAEMARGAAVLTDIGPGRPDPHRRSVQPSRHRGRHRPGEDPALDPAVRRCRHCDRYLRRAGTTLKIWTSTAWSSTAAAACSPAGRCSSGSRKRAARAWRSPTTGWPSPCCRESSSARCRPSRLHWTHFSGNGQRSGTGPEQPWRGLRRGLRLEQRDERHRGHRDSRTGQV